MKKRLFLYLIPVLGLILAVGIATATPTPLTGGALPAEQTLAELDGQAVQPSNQVSIPPSGQADANNAEQSVKAGEANSAPKASPPKTKPNQTSRGQSPASAQPSTPKAASILSTARQLIGVNYVWGGTTPAGFDCSGFTQYVFAMNGISLPRTSRDQYTIGKAVAFNNLQPGDLVFFSMAQNGIVSHEGIYAGSGQFINASTSKGVAVYSLNSYWTARYMGAKRVL